MNATYDEKTKTLTITLQCGAPHPSATGKTLVIGSSGGNKPLAATYQGKPIYLGVNAYIKP